MAIAALALILGTPCSFPCPHLARVCLPLGAQSGWPHEDVFAPSRPRKMDPTTTLVTFMLESTFRVSSLNLIGSWDNFSKRYPMERDSRRGRDQWRGCFALDDAVCHKYAGAHPGGLKMGCTYYYFYEIDGDIETFDPSNPVTSSCPILPGQPVNVLDVPISETRPRSRCASLHCLAPSDFMTTNPRHKYNKPRPSVTPYDSRAFYLNTSWSRQGSQRSLVTPSHLRRLWSTMLPYAGYLATKKPVDLDTQDLRADDNMVISSRAYTSTANQSSKPRTLAPLIIGPPSTELALDSAQSSTDYGYEDMFDSFENVHWPDITPISDASLASCTSPSKSEALAAEKASSGMNDEQAGPERNTFPSATRGGSNHACADPQLIYNHEGRLPTCNERTAYEREVRQDLCVLQTGAREEELDESSDLSSQYHLWTDKPMLDTEHRMKPRLEHNGASDTAVTDLQALFHDMGYLGRLISGH